jgi:hypothetical protein
VVFRGFPSLTIYAFHGSTFSRPCCARFASNAHIVFILATQRVSRSMGAPLRERRTCTREGKAARLPRIWRDCRGFYDHATPREGLLFHTRSRPGYGLGWDSVLGHVDVSGKRPRRRAASPGDPRERPFAGRGGRGLSKMRTPSPQRRSLSQTGGGYPERRFGGQRGYACFCTFGGRAVRPGKVVRACAWPA